MAEKLRMCVTHLERVGSKGVDFLLFICLLHRTSAKRKGAGNEREARAGDDGKEKN